MADLGDPVRVGIVGHGKAAELYGRALTDHPAAVPVGVCGRDLDRSRPFGYRFGIPVFHNVQEMIGKVGAQAIVVATPHPTHAPITLEAISAGAHVLVEKPMATTRSECDRMIAASDAAEVQLGVVSQRRFYTPVRRMKEAIDAGKLGTPVLATVTLLGWRDAGYYAADQWRGSWEGEGGGVLVNQAVHHLDLLQWLFGPAREVFGFWANLNHPEIEVEDSAVAVTRGPDGRLGAIVASNSQKPGINARIQIHGDNGASIGVQTDGGQMFIAGMTEIDEPPVTDLWTVPGEEHLLARWQDLDIEAFAVPDPILHYHRLQLDDFIQAICSGRRPAVDGRDGRRAVALFEAIYKAQKTMTPQVIDERA